MTLKTIAKCTKVLKKSQSPAFKDIQVGDNILFSCDIKPSGRWGGNTYATYIHCENMRTGEKSCLSFNQIQRVLDNFEFEEMKYL